MRKRSLYRWRRILLGYSQDQVAQLADVNQTVVSRLERGFGRNVSPEALARVGAILGINADRVSPKKGPTSPRSRNGNTARG